MNKKINIFVVLALLTFLAVDASDNQPRKLPSTTAMSHMASASGFNNHGEQVAKAPSPSRLAAFAAITAKAKQKQPLVDNVKDEERRLRLLQEPLFLKPDTNIPSSASISPVGQELRSVSPVNQEHHFAHVPSDSLGDFCQGGGPVTVERFERHSCSMNQNFSVLANSVNGPLHKTQDKVVGVIKRVAALQEEQRRQGDVLDQILALLQQRQGDADGTSLSSKKCHKNSCSWRNQPGAGSGKNRFKNSGRGRGRGRGGKY